MKNALHRKSGVYFSLFMDKASHNSLSHFGARSAHAQNHMPRLTFNK